MWLIYLYFFKKEGRYLHSIIEEKGGLWEKADFLQGEIKSVLKYKQVTRSGNNKIINRKLPKIDCTSLQKKKKKNRFIQKGKNRK